LLLDLILETLRKTSGSVDNFLQTQAVLNEVLQPLRTAFECTTTPSAVRQKRKRNHKDRLDPATQ